MDSAFNVTSLSRCQGGVCADDVLLHVAVPHQTQKLTLGVHANSLAIPEDWLACLRWSLELWKPKVRERSSKPAFHILHLEVSRLRATH